MSRTLLAALIVLTVAIAARVISDDSHVHRYAPAPAPDATVSNVAPDAPPLPSGPKGASCVNADSAPVTFTNLPGDTIGTAYLAPFCEIEIDPSVRADGPEAVCTVLAHERAHLRGREHGGSGLMRAKLPTGYVAAQCRSATANASDDSVFFRPASDGDGNGNVIPVPAVR
jgi:hypothetical protein